MTPFLDMPESMFPPPKPILFGVTDYLPLGTNADPEPDAMKFPEPDAMKFLAMLSRHFGPWIPNGLVQFRKLHFLGLGLTRETLIRCLHMTYGRDGAAKIESRLLATDEEKTPQNTSKLTGSQD